MERISAACAMEWSIELDKGLRSTTPGQAREAILQIGPRLEQWNREPILTMAEYNLFTLVPGEDRLFANAILLRLVNAFSSGDKRTKLCVAKNFLSELRHRKKRIEESDGILSKCFLENHLELLRRVKLVFDTQDLESRALALVLFGCWAGFAKDSADIRYVILSSLVSCHVPEVKASLFAAGCFCELSYEFSSVVLEILANMLISPETILTVRVAGARALAKIGCTSSLANRAYKAGLKLVLDSSEEDFLVAMMVSLSKLASKSTRLISQQVDLLFSFLTEERTLRLQVTALRCMGFLSLKGTCLIPSSSDSYKTLFTMLDESKFPPAVQCGALHLLHKILSYGLYTTSRADTLEFSKLLAIYENAAQSPIMVKRLLAIRMLIDLSSKLMGRTEITLDGFHTGPLASKLILFLIDRITYLVKLGHDLRQHNLEMERESRSLLSLLLLLVEEHPDLCGLVLSKISLFFEFLVNVSGNEIEVVGGDNSTFMTSNLLLYISRLVLSCLENLNESSALTTQVLTPVKLLAECVLQCDLFDSYIHSIYSLLLHYHIIFYILSDEIRETHILERNLGLSLHDYSLQNEILSLEYVKKILALKDNWSAYRAGKYAACQGAWFMAAIIFAYLTTKVQSNSCCCWLKSLAHFALSEMQIQLLLLPKQGSVWVNWIESNSIYAVSFTDDFGEIGEHRDWKVHSTFYMKHLTEACSSLHLSEETLGAGVTESHAFYFQRWFLALRAKVLQSVVDMLKLLAKQGEIHYSGEDRDIMEESPTFSNWFTSLVNPLTRISFKLKRLTWEFDIFAKSFIGMDSRSLKIISSLALSCSILAFSTGFSLFIPKLHAEKFALCCSKNSDCLHTMLVQDLVGRLSHIECEARTNLRLLMKICGPPKNYFLPLYGNQVFSGYETRGILAVCNYAVSGIVSLQNEANRLHDDEILSQVRENGLRLLLDIVTKWMHIPFRTPIHFFRLRRCISSELFAATQDAKTPDKILVFAGFHLSLNLCLQLKNVPPDLPIRLTKLYCILRCKTSFLRPCQSGENKRLIPLGYQDWGDDDLVDMNEKLLQYVTGRTKNTYGSSNMYNARTLGVVDACVCFEPNERGQGFSTCLLDVSSFPVGSYRIKWLSCCFGDNGSYWNLPSSNDGLVFTVQRSSGTG